MNASIIPDRLEFNQISHVNLFGQDRKDYSRELASQPGHTRPIGAPGRIFALNGSKFRQIIVFIWDRNSLPIRQFIGPADDAAIHKAHVVKAGPFQNALGFVTAQADFAEDDDLLIVRQLAQLIPELAQRQ